MIQLFIESQEINLNKEISLTVMQINPLFDPERNRGGYTYDIEVSLDDPKNARMYKHINHINASSVATDRTAVLKENGEVIIEGKEVILECSSRVAKIQILSGNSELNIEFSKKRMLDLDLGEISPSQISANSSIYGEYPGWKYICCPIMLEQKSDPSYSAYKDKCANMVDVNYLWTERSTGVTGEIIPQPFVLYVLQKVIEASGWIVDYSSLEENEIAKRMLVIHAYHTSNLNEMVPNWEVSEFLNEIQKFFNVAIITDSKTKKVSFYDFNEWYDRCDTIHYVNYENIIFDENSPSRFENEDNEYEMNYDCVAYALPEERYYHRAELTHNVKNLVKVVDCNGFDDVKKHFTDANYNKGIIYKEVVTDTEWYEHFPSITRTNGNITSHTKKNERVNQFCRAKKTESNDEDKTTTFNIVPAIINDMRFKVNHTKDYGPYDVSLFYNVIAIPYAYNNDVAVEKESAETTADKGLEQWLNGDTPETIDTSGLKMQVAIWLGRYNLCHVPDTSSPETKAAYENAKYPQCYTHRYFGSYMEGQNGQYYTYFEDCLWHDPEMEEKITFDLKKRMKNVYAGNKAVDLKERFEIKFLKTENYDVKNIFIIQGRKFACVSIEETIENGVRMPYCKGTFVPFM